jgi:pseudaminic acid synthase
MVGNPLKNKTIPVEKYNIGPQHQPFVIAEMSGNHNGSLERALKIVDMVSECGAQAIKLQTYTPDTMTININKNEFYIGDKSSLWEGKSLYKLYEEAQTPWEWHKPIFERARKHGLVAFSSPFDVTAVDYLESLNVSIYKIASAELVDLNLIHRVAQTKKPIIMSTGMASIAEIHEAVSMARSNGCPYIMLLKCTATYPATPEESNLNSIPVMREVFDLQIGLSDHTLGIGAAIAAVAMGATVVEKHVTLARTDGGVDSAFSLEPHELKMLVSEAKVAQLAMGKTYIGPTAAEHKSLKFRRSLYAVEDIMAGQLLTEKNVRAIRPGLGLPPKNFSIVLGRKAKCDIKLGTAINWTLID